MYTSKYVVLVSVHIFYHLSGGLMILLTHIKLMNFFLSGGLTILLTHIKLMNFFSQRGPLLIKGGKCLKLYWPQSVLSLKLLF